MSYHALAIDDSPEVLAAVTDRLEALGHTCDCAGSIQSAREYLSNAKEGPPTDRSAPVPGGRFRGDYAYVVLDLEIPVRYGRPSRIPNGQCLLREIRSTRGYEHVPIIVLTAHGEDGPDLAVEVLRNNGASDFVSKKRLDEGMVLERAIEDALSPRKSGHSWKSGPPRKLGCLAGVGRDPVLFEQGQMVFYPSRVELCDVKVCGGPDGSMIRRILDQLRQRNRHGKYVQLSGSELAARVGCERGQNGVAEAVRGFRDQVCELMLAEAKIQIDRLNDVILNDHRNGYRLSPKITVVDGAEGTEQVTGIEPEVGPESDPDEGGEDPDVNPRQRWVLEQLRSRRELRKADIVAQFRCSASTAERDLKGLRQRGLIAFIGPARTGYWRQVGGTGAD